MILHLLFAFASAYVFEDNFDVNPFENDWVQSDWKTSEGIKGKFEWTSGKWAANAANKGLQTSQDAHFYAISKQIPSFNNEGKDLVFQFTVKNEQGLQCGGAYWKLIGSGLDQKNFDGNSEYSIMFGPDICGQKRIHAIFSHEGEKLLIKNKKGGSKWQDELTHVYTLIVKPDNTYEILIDGDIAESGSMYEDWDFEKAKMIKDPNESKPQDWVDNAMMDDPTDEKPEDWDQPEEIVDPDAEMPEDWEEEDDGEWEPPMMENPEYKGEWHPKRIDNPAYKGPWEHPMIDNPEYVNVPDVYKRGTLEYVAMEVWQVQAGTVFDNILVTDDTSLAEKKREAILSELKDEEASKAAFDEDDDEEDLEFDDDEKTEL